MEEKLLDARIRALMIAAVTMAFVIVTITLAMIAGLFTSNELIDNKDVFALLSYVMTSVVGAVAGSYATLMGMKAENAPPPFEPPARDDEPDAPAPDAPPPAPTPITTAPAVEPVLDLVEEAPAAADDDDDDDEMAPWERYRNDLRYDANGDGVVDENDFPDWRSAGK